MVENKRGYQRKLINFIVDPLFQFRFAAQIVGILAVFSIAFGAFSFLLIGLIYRLFEMTEMEPAVALYVDEQVIHLIVGMGITLVIFFLITIAFILIETHKIVGAKYAMMKYFRDYLFKGNYQMCLRLRKKDYFQDLAETINKFVVQVGQDKKG